MRKPIDTFYLVRVSNPEGFTEYNYFDKAITISLAKKHTHEVEEVDIYECRKVNLEDLINDQR